MNRIATTFAALAEQKRKALIPYVTAGFPYADITPALMHGMVTAGADVIELGVPFSDPSADGAVIQKAGDRALALGIGLAQVLGHVKTFREEDPKTPGRWHGAGAGPGARIPQTQQHHPCGADGLRQPGGTLRPEAR